MTEQNKGKIALVTGANRGIGLETVKQLAQQGMHVLLGARVCRECFRFGRRCDRSLLDDDNRLFCWRRWRGFRRRGSLPGPVAAAFRGSTCSARSNDARIC